jgi:hypothetical protein
MELTEEEAAAINSSSAHPMGNPLNLRSWGHPPTKIADKLWIGGLYDAFNHVLLAKLRIGAVINVMGSMFNLGIVQGMDAVPVCSVPEGIGYACFKTLQPFGQTITQAKAAIQAIKFYRDNIGVNVFVHCGEGIDRGPTIVWKYLVESGTSPDAAEGMIKARSIVVVHKDWWDEYQEYAVCGRVMQ